MHLGPWRGLNSIYTSCLYNEPFGSSRKPSSIHIQDCLVLNRCFRAYSEGFSWDVKSKLSLQRDFSLDHVIIIIITGNKTAEQQNPFIDEDTFHFLCAHIALYLWGISAGIPVVQTSPNMSHTT